MIFNVSDDIWAADIDAGQIGQVINNLIINAMQAIGNGGTITVSINNYHIGQESAMSLFPGDYVQVTIEDTGCGIPQETMNKIFDPYFTTKENGNGLGLASCYSIIKNHEGMITVSSVEGQGTTFSLYLPAYRGKTMEVRIERSGEPVFGKGRILVMDDEEINLTVAQNILSYLGYEVVCVKKGEEAIQVYQDAIQNGEMFDIVIMDLTIPGGMGGEEAIQHLLRIDPQVKAIVSSGYSNNPITSKYETYGFKAVVSKPYEIEEISRIINELITRGALR